MNINNLLDKLIKSRNFTEYAFAYNTHPTPSPYYKSIMLLHLLTTNIKEYYKALQTISVEEANSQEINFIIQLDLLINTCNLKKIKEIKASDDIQYFIDKIISISTENQNIKEKKISSKDYYKDIIKDCMFVSRN